MLVAVTRRAAIELRRPVTVELKRTSRFLIAL
jgi:hypothetical protein